MTKFTVYMALATIMIALLRPCLTSSIIHLSNGWAWRLFAALLF